MNKRKIIVALIKTVLALSGFAFWLYLMCYYTEIIAPISIVIVGLFLAFIVFLAFYTTDDK